MSVVVVSVDGGGGGCLVSSCRWCAMFFFEIEVDFWLRMILKYLFGEITFFFLDHPPPLLVIERPRSCGKNYKGWFVYSQRTLKT